MEDVKGNNKRENGKNTKDDIMLTCESKFFRR